MVIILIGPPGSGKDTQAQILAKKYDLVVVSPGEALREAIENNHPLAAEIKSYTQTGHLVPDNITDQVLRSYIASHAAENIIFTGFPRRKEQLKYLDKLLEDLNLSLTAIIYLELSEADVVDRLGGRLYARGSDRVYHERYNPPQQPGIDDETGEELIRRPDDNPDAIKERLAEFHKYNHSLMTELGQQRVIHRIDAGQPIEQVTEAIEEQLKSL